jgi:hypothetical protein
MQTLHDDLSHEIGRQMLPTKFMLELHQGYASGHDLGFATKPLTKSDVKLATEARLTTSSLSVTLTSSSLWSSTKEGVSSSPVHGCHHRSTQSRRVDDLPVSHQDSKRPIMKFTKLVHFENQAQDNNTLLDLSHSS